MIAKTRPKHPSLNIYMTDCLQTIVRFSKKRRLVVSQKPEGRPVCLTYSKGNFVEATALETGGLAGADVTEALCGVLHIPATIPCDEDLEVYGTVVLPWEQYKIFHGGKEYVTAFPDELAKGIVDGTARVSGIRLELIVWHCGGIPRLHNKQDKYRQLTEWGFRTVNHRLLLPGANIRQIKGIQKVMNPFSCGYPIGSLVFEDNEQSRGLRCLALKWNYDISAAYRLCADGRVFG